MSTNSYKVASPYETNHIKLFNDFESHNDNRFPVTQYLIETRDKYSKEEYDKNIMNNNEMNIIVFSMDKDKIKDYCWIREERDIKLCELLPAQLNKTPRTREIMDIASNYAFNREGMERVFVSIEKSDNLYNQLLNEGYIDLDKVDETSNKNILQKEKEDMIEMSKVM